MGLCSMLLLELLKLVFCRKTCVPSFVFPEPIVIVLAVVVLALALVLELLPLPYGQEGEGCSVEAKRVG